MLFLRHAARIDVTTEAGTLFQNNQFQLRCEIPAAVGILRPQALCVTYITAGS
jgi:hypothetical protein